MSVLPVGLRAAVHGKSEKYPPIDPGTSDLYIPSKIGMPGRAPHVPPFGTRGLGLILFYSSISIRLIG